jgi:lysophospholipid acyltransferase (LPLAT)-like uncharacterized protein
MQDRFDPNEGIAGTRTKWDAGGLVISTKSEMGKASTLSSSRNRVAFDTRALILGEALYWLTNLVESTVRLEVHGKEDVLAYKRQGRSLIFAGWHGHDFVNLGAYRPVLGGLSNGALMLRDNPDGRVLHQFGRRMRFEVVSLGASAESPRWARGVATLIGLVRSGFDAMLAVDGPQGPVYQVKPGAAHMALRANAVIVPTVAAASPAIRLTYRWDKHLVPLPGARVVIEAGPIIDPNPPDGSALSVEEVCARIGAALDAGTRRAEARLHTSYQM